LDVIPAEIDVVSTEYPLSGCDIREIQRVTLAAGITQPVHHLQARSHYEVSVICGEPWLRDVKMTSFTARRKDGRWVVDKSSISKSEPIILE